MKKAMDFVKNELKEIIRVSAVYTIHYFEYSKLYTFEGAGHGLSYMIDTEFYNKMIYDFVENILKEKKA